MPFFVLGAPALGAIATPLTTKITVALAAIGLSTVLDDIREQLNAFFLSDEFAAVMRNGVEGFAAQYIAQRTGIVLNDVDPFSKVSFNAAISQKMGINFTDITDRNQVMIDLGQGVSDLLNLQTGMTLPPLRLNDPAQLKSAFQAEIAVQAVNALAGQLSVLDDATLAMIKAAALSDAFGQAPPSILPTKKQLQQRVASRNYYQREYAAGRRRNWGAKPPQVNP